MSELTVYGATEDSYSKLGMQHFAKKFGLSYTTGSQDADIYVGYPVPEEVMAKVQILTDGTVGEDTGKLTNPETISLCQKVILITNSKRKGELIDRNAEQDCAPLACNKISINFDISTQIGKIIAHDHDNYFPHKYKILLSSLSKDKLNCFLQSPWKGKTNLNFSDPLPTFYQASNGLFEGMKLLLNQGARFPHGEMQKEVC